MTQAIALPPPDPEDFYVLDGIRLLTKEAASRRNSALRELQPYDGPYSCPADFCPYCGEICDNADWVDVGVGNVQCGPYHCEACFASEQGPGARERELSAAERLTGWYAPGALPDSTANVIGGQFVSHDDALAVYRGLYPLTTDDQFVTDMREAETPAAKMAGLFL